MDETTGKREIAKRDEIIRRQAEEIAALKREVAELKSLLKEKAVAKDAKRPVFPQDYSLSRQERQRRRKRRTKSSGRKPTAAKQQHIERTDDIYPQSVPRQRCEWA